MTTNNNNNNSNNKITIIHCWSAPRSRSTALLYSFESRGNDNCYVIDEPLYREWLVSKGDTVIRPYTENLINGIMPDKETSEKETETDHYYIDEEYKWKRELKSLEERIHDGIMQLQEKQKQHQQQNSNNNNNNNNKNDNNKDYVIFCKHMAKHCYLYDFERECRISLQEYNNNEELYGNNFVNEIVHKHILLIRDPVSVLSSWNSTGNANLNSQGSVHGNNPTSDEIGIIPLLSIYSTLSSLHHNNNNNNNNDNSSNNVVLLDSDDLVSYPESTLNNLCNNLNISYKESMLSWKQGQHICDGPWARWWYYDVHKSNGWIRRIRRSNDNNNNNNSNNKEEEEVITSNYPSSYDKSSSSPSSSSTHGSGKRYRTLNSKLLPALRASLPAYDFLKSCTTTTTGTTTNNNNTGTTSTSSSSNIDQRNNDLLVYVGAPGKGRLYPKNYSGSPGGTNGGSIISLYDSSILYGDSIYEDIRIYNNGKIFLLNKHLDRLLKSALALGYDNIHPKEEIIQCIYQTLAINNMRGGNCDDGFDDDDDDDISKNDCHYYCMIRLILTRGEKCKISIDNKYNMYGTTLIILPEYKKKNDDYYDDDKNEVEGISLLSSSSSSTTTSSTFIANINHTSLINNVIPKLQSSFASVDDALLLDMNGYVTETTNRSNIFMIVQQEQEVNNHNENNESTTGSTSTNAKTTILLSTPKTNYCLPGITRDVIIDIASSTTTTTSNIVVDIRDISLSDLYTANEVFITNDINEIIPVINIDGRVIGNGTKGPITCKLQEIYKTLPNKPGYSIDLPPFDTGDE